MEDVLDVYQRPYDPAYPVVCMDESSKQLMSDAHEPIAMQPGQPIRVDDEYQREGVAQLFVAIEPLTGRDVIEVEPQRTKIQWARFIRKLLKDEYPEATKVVLVLDNLNTHGIASLYEAFEPEEAHSLARKLELHFTPKHGSWLNVAEIDLSILSRQCLDRRIDSIAQLQQEIASWQKEREPHPIQWHFTSKEARIKLRRLYPPL